jgi:hypothetical protein
MVTKNINKEAAKMESKRIELDVTKRDDFVKTHKIKYCGGRTSEHNMTRDDVVDTDVIHYGGYGVVNAAGEWVKDCMGRIQAFCKNGESKAGRIAMGNSIADYMKKFDGMERARVKALGRIGNGQHSHALNVSLVDLGDCYLAIGATDSCGSSKWTQAGYSRLYLTAVETDGTVDYNTVTCSKCRKNAGLETLVEKAPIGCRECKHGTATNRYQTVRRGYSVLSVEVFVCGLTGSRVNQKNTCKKAEVR